MKFRNIVFLAAVISSGCSPRHASNLKCEYLRTPAGIDEPAPRFTWEGGAGNITVGSDSAAVARGRGDMWSARTGGVMPVVYGGKPLEALTRYYWKAGDSVSWFETGTMSRPWPGEWISDGNDADYRPAPYLRREFDVREGVVRARAYVCAAGLFELSVNGVKAGDHMFDPVFTAYDKRNLYLTLDLTPLLRPGTNAAGLLLGNGWYNHQSHAVWSFENAPWRARPAVTAWIAITYADGSRQTVATDGSWRCADSPVTFNCIYTSEQYDANKELPGWDTAGYDDSAWSPAVVRTAPSARMVSQQMVPVRAVAVMRPDSSWTAGRNCMRFRFPRNIAGATRLKIKGEKGSTVRVKHAERLFPDGSLCMTNINLFHRPTDDGDPFQTDVITLSGGEDVFMPRFNYKGFQYAEVLCSSPLGLDAVSIEAVEIHSDPEEAGGITCSNDIINRIHAAGRSSYLSNLFGYPTDCPQREKNGWTGDGHIAIETGLYNFDAITVYEKWMEDFKDAQRPDGMLPAIIPTAGWGWEWANGTDWTSAVAIIPWQVYMFYGDSRLLERMYDNIKLYVDRIALHYPDGITDWGLGDWVPHKAQSDKTLTCSIYYYADAQILSKAARLLGRDEDAERYGALAAMIRDSINGRFLDRGKGIYCSGTQTELAAPLYWGVVPDDMRAAVAANLNRRVADDGGHIDAGLLGSKALLCALSENGYAQTAYRVASYDEYPSWGYWMKQGATTLYENWYTGLDAVNEVSLNHIMFGEICAWFYKGLGGIYLDENAPGFRHTVLRPNFVEGLDNFSAWHRTPYGKLVSEWERKDGKIIYRAVIPERCAATLFAAGKERRLGPGKHVFTF